MPKANALRFVDLFAGLGGFHAAMARLGHEFVFASELDDELRELYTLNHRVPERRVGGDIAEVASKVPAHEILCAGFPCQPFSKSGRQQGFFDQARGTVFYHALEVARRRQPDLILLENVGNFARHDGGRTWSVVKGALEDLGYDVRGTLPKVAGGHGLISPHHMGFPHHRERFFIVAARWSLPSDPFPRSTMLSDRAALENVIVAEEDLTPSEKKDTALSPKHVRCIDHWNRFLTRLPHDEKLPSFPIWGDEIRARYPFTRTTPALLSLVRLRAVAQVYTPKNRMSRAELMQTFPAYARARHFPAWKIRFIQQNREFFAHLNGHIDDSWVDELYDLASSLRKLEWNCQDAERDLWDCVLQFRPSGLRAKRYVSVPALVAMTLTQIPILGPERRHITQREGLRLLGLPDDFVLPRTKSRAFTALGNGVHSGVVEAIANAAIATAPAGYVWGRGRRRRSPIQIA
jgi:DNA (cytosine-5)-methyltransferase 1